MDNSCGVSAFFFLSQHLESFGAAVGERCVRRGVRRFPVAVEAECPSGISSPEAFTGDCGAAIGTNVNQDQTNIYCDERMRTGASSLEVAELGTCDSRKASDTLENDCRGEDARRHTKDTVASCVLALMR